MRYVSIDIETTGLDPDVHEVVEVGAVIDDLSNPRPLSELSTFHCYVIRDTYVVDPYCAFLHQALFHRISQAKENADKWRFLRPNQVARAFEKWLIDNGIGDADYLTPAIPPAVPSPTVVREKPKFTPAGKNFGSFDLQFLNRLPEWKGRFRIHHRQLDPAVLYFDPKVDTELPNQQVCLDRAGIAEQVEHTAVEDAMQIVKLVRHKLGD